MATPKALPTCPSCGNPNFDETKITLQATVESGSTAMTGPMPFWTRACNQCGQVTFWSRPSGK